MLPTAVAIPIYHESPSLLKVQGWEVLTTSKILDESTLRLTANR